LWDEIANRIRKFHYSGGSIGSPPRFGGNLRKLIRVGRRTPLPVASDAKVGRYAWRRTACRQLLRDKPSRAEHLSELIDLAADDTAGDWRSPVVWWAKRHVRPAELASLVQAELAVPAAPRSPTGG
jgi:hypothetical protein